MADKKTSLTSNQFHCEKCDFKCSYYSEYERHLATAKHKILTNADRKRYHCNCGKAYKHRQSYHKHKKICDNKSHEELLAETMKQQLEEQRKRDEEQKEEQLKLLQEQKEEQIKILQEQNEEQRKILQEQRKLLQEQKEVLHKYINIFFGRI